MIEVADIKLAVLRCALGICAIEEAELYKRLEAFWVDAYKQGCVDTGEAMKAFCDERSLKLVAEGKSGDQR